MLLPWGLCVILLGVCVAFGYYAYAIAPSRAAVDARAEADATASAKSASAVGGEVASSGDVVLEAKGYIIPVHQIQVSPKVAGMLVDVDPRLEEGAHFKQGDVLAKIEDVDYRTTYEHADRAYVAAQERWEQAKACSSSRCSRPRPTWPMPDPRWPSRRTTCAATNGSSRDGRFRRATW